MYRVAKDPRYHLRVNVLSRSFSCGALRSQNKGELITECVKRLTAQSTNRRLYSGRADSSGRSPVKASQVRLSFRAVARLHPSSGGAFVCVCCLFWIELFLSARRQGEDARKWKDLLLVSLINRCGSGLKWRWCLISNSQCTRSVLFLINWHCRVNSWTEAVTGKRRDARSRELINTNTLDAAVMFLSTEDKLKSNTDMKVPKCTLEKPWALVE